MIVVTGAGGGVVGLCAYLLNTTHFWAEHTITFREEIREVFSGLLAVDCFWSQGQLKPAVAK